MSFRLSFCAPVCVFMVAVFSVAKEISGKFHGDRGEIYFTRRAFRKKRKSMEVIGWLRRGAQRAKRAK